jgi:predicted amidohydrolase YtcJ
MKIPALFALAVLSTQILSAAHSAEMADMVIIGGPIHTADDRKPDARAVAVSKGRIVYVGNAGGVNRWIGEHTLKVDLDGAAMFPGLVDSHVHLAGVGERELTLNLEGSASIVEVQKRLADYLARNPGTEPVKCRGWIETHWPEHRFLTADDLDQIEKTRPVVLTRADGHALVGNSAALAAAGITADTQAPDGGQILRNSDGTPNGMFVDHAMSLMAPLIKAPTPEQWAKRVAAGARVYAQYGWTGAHAMSVSAGELKAMRQTAQSGQLGLRVYAAVDKDVAFDLIKSGRVMRGPLPNTNGLVTARAVKLYMDGALGSRGAALIEPYSDAEGTGLVLMNHDAALPVLTAMLKAGMQVATHAIGDRGNRLALDWYEQAFAAVPAAQRGVVEPRWRIEHAQIIDPADLPRFAKMAVIASMQPSHAIGDLYFAPSRLGADRLAGAYAWADLWKSGAIVTGGSDAPVERGDPMIEFYAAVARRGLDGFQDAATWHPEQALSRDDALKLFTLNAAISSFAEKDLGTIAVGKRADFTILSQDILRIPEAEILTTKAKATIVNGAFVYKAPGFNP